MTIPTFPISLVRLGDFSKFLATNFLTKVAQIFGIFWAILKSINFAFITAVATFWPTIWGYRATFLHHMVTLFTVDFERVVVV